MKQSVALIMKNLMIEKGRRSIWYGDLELIEECAKISNIKAEHPKIMIKRILDQLDHSPYFSKGYIVADFCGNKRRYRCFILETGTAED